MKKVLFNYKGDVIGLIMKLSMLTREAPAEFWNEVREAAA